MIRSTRRLALAVGATVLVLATSFRAAAADAPPTPIPVVASFSILGDLVSQVGGDRVAVTVLVGPDGDAHVYQPTPADAAAVANASLVVVNGLGFEGWMDRLIEASGYTGDVLVATTGIDPLPFVENDDHHADEDGDAHDESDTATDAGMTPDPHAFQSVANAHVYVTDIVEALSRVDPAGADEYAAAGERYLTELDALGAEVQAAIATLPEDRRTVVTSHDAFGYYGAAYGLTFEAPQGISTESEPSAADMAGLIVQIRDDSIPAVFIENITDNRMLEQITSETDAKIGGTLYSDALSGPDGPAATYVDMMRHNTRTLVEGLK